MPSETPVLRLRDIVANVDRIQDHLSDRLPATDLDAKTRDAVERCLERISEAARKVGSEMDDKYPGVPWRNIRGLGNILRHDYDVVDDEIIEHIATNELAALRQACVAELAVLGGDSMG